MTETTRTPTITTSYIVRGRDALETCSYTLATCGTLEGALSMAEYEDGRGVVDVTIQVVGAGEPPKPWKTFQAE